MTGIKVLRRGGLALVWLVPTFWAAGPAAAQTPPAITLADAVRTSLDKAPVVQLAHENVNAQQATLRIARGTFDAVFSVGPLFEHREDSTVDGGTLENEKVKRGLALGLSQGFGQVAAALDQQLQAGRTDLPVCPTNGSWSIFVATLPGTTLPVPLCRPASTALGVQSVSNLDGANINASSLYRQPSGLDPMATYDLQLKIANVYQVQVGSSALDAHERGFQMLYELREVAHEVETRAGLTYTRLGALPDYQYTDTTSIVGGVSKPLRNGTLLQIQATFDGRGAQFRGKPLDTVFGGRDTLNRYGSKIEAFWVQPLKRGRGATTVQAPERAAQTNIDAARYTYQQTAADQTLATANAYFSLIAAQESLALTQQSLETQRRTLETTIKLVGAGEVASSDVTRARARTSEVEADVETARLAVIAAQAGLATAMGVSSAEMATLAATDVFPARPADLEIETLSRDAVSRRSDVKAAASFRETSKTLMKAALADIRMRFDLTFSGGFAEVYYGPPFHSLPEELKYQPNQSTDSWISYYNLTGIGRAFGRKWEPVAAVSGVIELPFGNNQRLGRLAQARASLAESEIRLADVRRVIQANVPQYSEDVRRTRAEWEQRQEAVIQYASTWDTTQRLRAAGDMTLIDTLLTEQQMTQARLQLVEAKRAYASAVAQFKRETGTLVVFSDWTQGQPNLAGIVAGR
jgi:outer membrane protein TolC